MDAAVTVKGTRDGLLVTFEAGELPELMSELAKLFESRKAFFRGGKVALQVLDLKLSLAEVIRLRQTVESNGIELWAVLGADPETIEAVGKAGLQTHLPKHESAPELARYAEDSFIAGTGILVQRTLRSGQSVHHAGHVVVIGDVNPGSEIIAGGDVIVWGSLRGTVHAGAAGDEARSVCALDLSPTQLRIGNHIARPPDNRRRRKTTYPERAFVSDGQLVAERWK
jgi:septum site-determining protein MinC